MKYGHLFWAIILIAIGGLFLIANIGWIDFHWTTVWRLWPLILIFWGIAILPIRDLIKYILLIGTIVLTIVFFNKLTAPNGWFRWHDGNSEWSFNDEWRDHDKYSSRKMESQTLTVPFDSVSRKAKLVLEAAAGDFTLEGVTTDMLSFSKNGNIGNYSLTSEDTSGTKKITIHLEKSEGPRKFTKNEVEIRLNQSPVWDFNFDIGAATIDMDLKDYRVDTIEINAGASSINLTLGSRNPVTFVTFDAGASSLDIRVPKESACQVKSESFLVSRDFEGFTKKGSGLYQSENFSTGKNKIFIDIETAVSSISIERY